VCLQIAFKNRTGKEKNRICVAITFEDKLPQLSQHFPKSKSLFKVTGIKLRIFSDLSIGGPIGLQIRTCK
jgi:hypothetical protein